MAKIEIQACMFTANVHALEAVAKAMLENSLEQGYLKVRKVTIESGLKFEVTELANNDGICDCKFRVQAEKASKLDTTLETHHDFDTDSARTYIHDICNKHFNDKTFGSYIERGLAGDFAYQLATHMRAATKASEERICELEAMLAKQRNAIEHAEYLAKSAERLLEYLNDVSDIEEGVINPDDRYGDHVGTIRSYVHEFRKRAQRANFG